MPGWIFISDGQAAGRFGDQDMDGVSLTANTRAALNGADGQTSISALKIAAASEKAIVQVVEEASETAKALAPEGQGLYVDKRV